MKKKRKKLSIKEETRSSIVAIQKLNFLKTIPLKRVAVFFLTLISCLSTALYSQVIDGPINNSENCHTYYLLEASSWSDAEEIAVSLGGHLVTINNSDEEDFVFNIFGAGTDGSGIDRPLWIGYTDLVSEGTWVWISGEVVDPIYTNWASTEPNNYGCGEDYGEIYPNYISGYGGLWTDNDNEGNGGCSGTTVLGFGVVEVNCPTPIITPAGPITICNGSSAILKANEGLCISYQWLKGGKIIVGATDKTYKAKHSNDFTVVETTPSGCVDTSDVVTLIVNPSPCATITPLGDLDICIDDSVILQVCGGIDNSYQWKKGGVDIAGATEQEFIAYSKGTYKVVVTNSYDCSKTSKGIKVTKSCFKKAEDSFSSNEDFLHDSKITIYPNPISISATIEFNLENNSDVSIKLYDASGRVVLSVFEGELVSGNQKIELNKSDLVSGIYFMQIITGNEIQRIKVIID